MVTVVVVVFNEVGDGLLQLAREFIRDLVHFPLDALVVALQLPIGLRMIRCRQDMPDANEVKIVPKDPGDVASAVVREQSGAVIPEKPTIVRLEELKEVVLQTTAAYAAEFYPELLDPLVLRDYIDTE